MLNLKRLAAGFLALLWAIPAWCVPGVGVSVWNPGSGTSVTSTAVTTQSTGSTFLCIPVYRQGGGGTLPTTVVDNKSNTYVLANSVNYGFGFSEIGVYISINGAGGAGHTCTASGWTTSADLLSISFVELTGMGAATLDAAPAGTNDNASPSVPPSITTTVANEWVLNIYANYSNNDQTITDTGSGYAIIVKQEVGANGITGAISYVVPASSGTATNDSFSFTTADFAGATAISIKPGGAGATCTHAGWSSGGTFAVPTAGTGNYWRSNGSFATVDCSSNSYWQSSGAFGVN